MLIINVQVLSLNLFKVYASSFRSSKGSAQQGIFASKQDSVDFELELSSKYASDWVGLSRIVIGAQDKYWDNKPN